MGSVIVKKQGYGIKPKFIDVVVGREAKRDIREDKWITWDDILVEMIDRDCNGGIVR